MPVQDTFYMSPLQRIVRVNFPAGERNWLLAFSFGTDSSFAPGVFTAELTSISLPFSAGMMLDRSIGSPVQLETIPADYPGITQVIDTVTYEDPQYLVAGNILASDTTVKQWTYEQTTRSDPIATPELWEKDNLQVYNMSKIPANATSLNMSGIATLSSAGIGELLFVVRRISEVFDPEPIRDLNDFGVFTTGVSGARLALAKDASDPVTTASTAWTLSLNMETFEFSGTNAEFGEWEFFTG